MNSRFKRLALTVSAILALTGLTASASQAANFTAASYPATLKGEQSRVKAMRLPLLGDVHGHVLR